MASRKSAAKNTTAPVATPEADERQTLPAGTAELMDAMQEVDELDPPADVVAEEPTRPESQRVTVSLLLGELDPSEYRSAHIDMHLTPEQADVLRELSLGHRGMPFELAADGVNFRDGGRLVDSGPNALRWLLNGLVIAKRRRTLEAQDAAP
jgi:hypothetical protein